MSFQAIVLVGGLGTRLRSVVKGLPKALAPVAGRPFLEHLLGNLAKHGFGRIILATGYRADAVRGHFGEVFGPLSITYSEEDVPLGTGGAVWKALTLANSGPCFVLNGDTWSDLDYPGMLRNHLVRRAELSVGVREVSEVGRFGAVETANGRVVGFQEKGASGPGFINAGVYILSPEIVSVYPMPPSFSLESDLIETHLQRLQPSAWVIAGQFIDIGVPEDLERAQGLFGSAGP